MLKLSLTISTAILVVILGSVDGQEQQESTNCGDGRCLHGATCLEKTGTDGDSHFHCDCSTANTPEISYAGQWCQYQVTTFCTSINSNPRLFCVNNGVCKEDVYEGCDCPSGFSGFSCEYQVQVPVDFSPPATSSTNGQTVVGDPDHTGHKPQSDSPQEDASIYDEKDTTYVEQDTIIYERPATMICTEGDLGPAKPLSFCKPDISWCMSH